jgi:hypothetical protein
LLITTACNLGFWNFFISIISIFQLARNSIPARNSTLKILIFEPARNSSPGRNSNFSKHEFRSFSHLQIRLLQ